MRYRIHLLLVATAVLLSGAASASAIQSLTAVQSAAERFVRERLPAGAVYHVSAAALDPRLRLAACDAPLEAFAQNAAPNGARMTVGVRCPAAISWTLYVPVSIEVETEVLILRRALARRARITAADVEPQLRRLPGGPGSFVTDVTALQGQRLKRSLPAGAVLTVDALTPDILVRRGQQVTLIAANDRVEIRAQGLALSDGAENERVRVQNTASLKVVEGVVDKDGAVRVGL